MSTNSQAEHAVPAHPRKRAALAVAGSLERDRDESFWFGMLYAGMFSYSLVTPVLLVYSVLTWSRGHRGWMIGIVLAAVAALSATCLARRTLARVRQRLWVLLFWNIVSYLIITALCMLDGGIQSPITYLFTLSMLYMAIGFPPRAVLVCGAAGVLCYLGLLWSGSDTPSLGLALFQLLALGVGLLLAMLGARHRAQQNRALRLLTKRLEALAVTDELTGCLNQRAFKLALRRDVEHATRYGRPLALLLIDIDHFKSINDRYGHLVGDVVLRQLGAVLRGVARETDCVGRPGGDELALLAPETDGPAARALAERVRAEVRSAAAPIDITLSIGVCAMPVTSGQADEWFRHADEAMYLAKRRGRDQVALWHAHDARAAARTAPPASSPSA